MFDADAIYTDAQGRPIPRPEREGFPEGIEGTIAYMRATWAWKDKITDTANKAFADQFSKAMRRPKARRGETS